MVGIIGIAQENNNSFALLLKFNHWEIKVKTLAFIQYSGSFRKTYCIV